MENSESTDELKALKLIQATISTDEMKVRIKKSRKEAREGNLKSLEELEERLESWQ